MVTQPAPTPIALRDGHADDLDDVMAIMNGAFDAGFGERWTRSQCLGILPLTGVRLRLAAQNGGATDGFSLMRIVADEAELLLIAVAPKAQRLGLGQTLVDDFIAVARGGGATRLHLEVRDGNQALKLYDSSGFVVAGRRRDYYRGPDGAHFDALTLVLGE